MPMNADFSLEVLVGGCVLPEYSKDGDHFVECCLFTPITYTQKVEEIVNGEKEKQSVPVTPYTLRIRANITADNQYYYKLYVDGVKVKGISLKPGDEKCVRGFKDGHYIREFLFTLPRHASDEVDRVASDRTKSIGKILAECWVAELCHSKKARRDKNLAFSQANKKDCTTVTEGMYTMATSKAGKVLGNRSTIHKVDSYRRVSLRSQMTVHYHMAHTLEEMGFDIKPIVLPHNAQQTHRSSYSNGMCKDVKEENDVEIKTEDGDVEYVRSTGPSGSGGEPALIDLTDDDNER